MANFFLFIFFCCCTLQAASQQHHINVATELYKLSSPDDLPKYEENNFVHQFSSYDTTGNNDDGFSGKYSFIRKNPDSSLVLFEMKGSGVVNRIWTPTPNEDTLDFYFSASNTPSFSIKFSDLFSGKIYPFTLPLCGNQLGGYYCYFPIPYHDGCKIVTRGKNMQFYQIQCRQYPDAANVQNFHPALSKAEMAACKRLGLSWAQSFDPSVGDDLSLKRIHTDTTIAAGGAITLASVTNGGRIVGIKLKPAEAFAGLQKQIDIRISWDDEKYPAVYAPVADFFGYAFGKTSMQSLLLGSAENISYCYFPMPFDSKAKIELIYRPLENEKVVEPMRIIADVFISAKKRDKEKEGRFYAYWNKEANCPLGKPFEFLKGNGKGHYVATILQAQGRNPGMTLFFEGDDVTNIDGQMTMHGTGSEDYFNGGWYALLDRWDRKMSLPLHGSLDYSLPFARTGGYRLFLPDKMTFEKSINHTIEHGPENNNIPVDYTSVAMYYASAQVNRSQLPANELTTVYVPDTMMVYRQLMEFSFDGTFTMDGNSFIARNGGHLKVGLSDIPHGNYQLYADGETSDDGATISLWQRQTRISDNISFFSSGKIRKKIYLGDIAIDEFRNSITIHFNADENKKVNIERLILIRIRS
ncbi:MAG: glycoside hydrolase family 172 protein [Ferruginibacter sp.]